MKKCIGILLALLLCGCLAASCFAESFSGEAGRYVTLTADGKMESYLDADKHTALEPGDDITFSVRVDNKNPARTEWYMKNEILRSLEDQSASASGGAYSYRLAFVPDGGAETVLFDSDTVGGAGESPAGVGLHQADNALREYFYFATLAPGEGGTVTLYVAFEGESQGNAYQDTLADMRLNFAVVILGDGSENETKPTEFDGTPDEPNPPSQPGGNGDYTIVKTGDDTNLLPLFAVMAVSGLALLGLLLHALWRRNRKRGRFE